MRQMSWILGDWGACKLVTKCMRCLDFKLWFCFWNVWQQNRVVATQTFFMFTPKIGEDSHFDSYFSDGLVQPPTRKRETTRNPQVFQFLLRLVTIEWWFSSLVKSCWTTFPFKHHEFSQMCVSQDGGFNKKTEIGEMIQFDLRIFYKWFGLKPPTASQCLVFGCFGDWGVKKLGWDGLCRGGVVSFYHGKSPFCTTIWDDMFGTFFQASWPCKSKWGHGKKTIESVWLAQKKYFVQEWFNQPPTIAMWWFRIFFIFTPIWGKFPICSKPSITKHFRLPTI